MGIMCAGQVLALLACFSYQQIRGDFFDLQRSLGVSHLSKKTCFTSLASVRQTYCSKCTRVDKSKQYV